MKRISSVAAMFLASACSGPMPPADLSKADIGTLAGCPVLPGVGSMEVIRRNGPDFRLCEYKHANTGKVLFEVYVGDHPGELKGLRYGGTTRANGKDLVWFNTPTGGWGKPRVWHTFLPTGSPRGTVMVVTLTTHAPGQLQVFSRLISHLQPSL